MNRLCRSYSILAVWVALWGLFAFPLAPVATAEVRIKSFRQSFPAGTGEVRLANLMGKVELVQGQGNEVVVDAVVHAEGKDAAETQRLLDEMHWVRSQNGKGRAEWALGYPVDQYRGFHYPQLWVDIKYQPKLLSFLSESDYPSVPYRGQKVKLYPKRRTSAPTLFADLRISIPIGSNVALRNTAGPVFGGALEGTLKIDTANGGTIQLGSHSGRLTINGGPGNVIVGEVKGETSIFTGSGDVRVKHWIGNGSVSTGAGEIIVEQLATGKLSLSTGAGDVTVRNGTASKILADTGAGNVRLVGVEVEELDADTGSGDLILQNSLLNTKQIKAGTISGSVIIKAEADASFDIQSDQVTGKLTVAYADATLRRVDSKVVGAKRGDGRTVIRLKTISGACRIQPAAS